MTATTVPSGAPDHPFERDTNLVLARLHLRLGSLGLARAEFEGMAGSGDLDDEGLVDLAEARWRTGDLAGAGDAANLALSAGCEAVVAYVIAAEATAAVGRPAEARRLASKALELSDLSVLDVFAGMPRSSIWPIEPSDPLPSAMSLFDPGPGPGQGAGATHVAAPRRPSVSAVTPSLWDDDADLGDLPDPAQTLAAGRDALAAGDHAAAALQLGLTLRLAPTLAPIVLELIEPFAGPELALVRGDAFRLVGHERDARIAFASVAAAIPEPHDKEST